MSESEDNSITRVFDGAIEVHRTHEADRAFSYHVIFSLDHPHLIELSAQKPPMHFHPHQDEYITVLEGTLGVEVENAEFHLTPQAGEFEVKAWSNHRIHPVIDGSATKTRFLLSGAKTREAFQLDDIFFQNWYRYQDEVVMTRGTFSLIQIMSMFDAGGSYITFPTWIPFSRRLAQLTGIVIGRWLGGLLGYQPFYRKWTNNWSLACSKMATSIFHRRFARDTKVD